jgi:type II secretory pathway pseudopilin PulG
MTLVELCVVIVIIAILLAAATASLLRARVSANEVSAIGALKTINSAQVAYAAGCGQGNYAPTLVVLGTKPPGGREGYVTDDLASSITPQKSGYRINVRIGAGAASGPIDCNGTQTTTNYYAVAIPVTVGRTGSRSFATSQRNGVYQMNGGVPPPEPFGPPAELAQ